MTDGSISTRSEAGKRGHEDVGAEIASQVLGRLRYPTQLRQRVRADRARAHVRLPDPATPSKRATVPRTATATTSPSTCSCTSGPICGASVEAERATDGELDRLDGFRDARRAEREQPAPARRARRRRRRPDRGSASDQGPSSAPRSSTCSPDVVGDPTLNERASGCCAEAERQLALIRWQPPGPYEVAFSTRAGGVSEGPYASLNLGRMTGDDVERVDENRRRLCAEVGGGLRAAGAQPAGALGTRPPRASRARAASPATGSGRRSPTCPLLALTADCLPIALARVGGERPGVAVLHAAGAACWPGIVAAGRECARRAVARRDRPCDRAVLLRGRRRGGRAVRSAIRAAPCCAAGTSTCWTAAERALRDAGVDEVERVDICTPCNPELFFSHRRTGLPRGGQGVIARVA